MAGRLANEIKQRSFASPEAEAALNIFKTAEILGQKVNEFLKEFGMTSTQYNVLRILRGAGCSGLPCSQLGERMITRDPDITRLLDRMEKNGWVVRQRGCQDRRVVIAKITDDALSLIGTMDEPLAERLKSTLGQLKTPALTTLIGLLEDAREAVG